MKKTFQIDTSLESPKYKISYLHKPTIGSGQYGTVYYGIMFDKESKERQLVAVKSLKDNKNKFEVDALKKLSHNMNVVDIYDQINEDNYQFLIIQYGNRGTLEDYILHNHNSDLEIRYIFRQIAKGLKNIHEKGLLHRDIKCNNFIICDDTIKFVDFGEGRNLKLGDKAATLTGTPFYINPQALKGEKYTAKSDIFSLGATLFFMYYKRVPCFASKSEYKNTGKLTEAKMLNIYEDRLNIKEIGKIFTEEAYIDEDGKDLIKKMLALKEEDRFSIKDVLKHPYLENFEKDKIRQPKIVPKINKTLTQSKEFSELITREIHKKYARDIMERMFYERNKSLFLNKCIGQLVFLQDLCQNNETFFNLVILLTYLNLAHISLFYNIMQKRESPKIMAKKNKWKAFYAIENEKFYKEAITSIEEAYDSARKNFEEMYSNIRKISISKKISRFLTKNNNAENSISDDLLLLIEENILSILLEIIPSLDQKAFEEKENKNNILRILYNLLIILNFFNSIGFKKKAVNFEKLLEDQYNPNNLSKMKTRLMNFCELAKKKIKKI